MKILKDHLHFYRLFKPEKRKNNLLLVIICSMGLLFVSCGDNSTGTNGGDGNGNGNGNGNGTTTEPTFTNVLSIFESSCGGSGCHIGGTTSGVRLDSYDNVTTSEGLQYGELVVQANNAAGSPLVDKIESDNPDHGDRMPQGGSKLPADQINLIKDWIDEGAENN